MGELEAQTVGKILCGIIENLPSYWTKFYFHMKLRCNARENLGLLNSDPESAEK